MKSLKYRRPSAQNLLSNCRSKKIIEADRFRNLKKWYLKMKSHWFSSCFLPCVRLPRLSKCRLRQTALSSLPSLRHYSTVPGTNVYSTQLDFGDFWKIEGGIVGEVYEEGYPLPFWRGSLRSDVINGTLIGNHAWPIEWCRYQWHWVTLKVASTLWNLSISHTSKM